ALRHVDDAAEHAGAALAGDDPLRLRGEAEHVLDAEARPVGGGNFAALADARRGPVDLRAGLLPALDRRGAALPRIVGDHGQLQKPSQRQDVHARWASMSRSRSSRSRTFATKGRPGSFDFTINTSRSF